MIQRQGEKEKKRNYNDKMHMDSPKQFQRGNQVIITWILLTYAAAILGYVAVKLEMT